MVESDVQHRVQIRGEHASFVCLQNPLDIIAEDHMREREVCALLDRIVADQPVSEGQLDGILTFLNVELPQHLEDEEADLFPLLLKRCPPEDEITKVIDKLVFDHTHASADAPAVVSILSCLSRSTPFVSGHQCEQMKQFANQSRRHLILENAIILPIARLRLTGKDLKSMKANMLRRRGLEPYSGIPQ